MTVYVAFFTPAALGSPHVTSMRGARVSETVAASATSTGSAADGECVYVANDGAASVYVAIGSAPDATATTSTSATSARVALLPGLTIGLVAKSGDKISIAAVS